MPKKFSNEKKKEMVEDFKKGLNINQLSTKYSLTESTIKKHLKLLLGDISLNIRNKALNEISKSAKEKKYKNKEISQNEDFPSFAENINEKNEFENYGESFLEILPLNHEFDFNSRKDFASVPLTSESLPKNLYMIVDSNIELETKHIKDFPDYDFLSESEREKKVIKLFSDKKSATQNCDKSKKVIKIPDGKVFKLVAPILIRKGITRIIYEDNLLSI